MAERETPDTRTDLPGAAAIAVVEGLDGLAPLGLTQRDEVS